MKYLCLPAPANQLERTMLRAGIDGTAGLPIRLDFDELPEKVADALDPENRPADDLPGFNRMYWAIAPMKDADMEKLNG